MNKKIAYLNCRTIFSTSYEPSYGRLALILAGSILLTTGNVFLRWSIGKALDTGNLRMSLLFVAGVLLILAQLIAYNQKILAMEVQKNLYGKIQSKVLDSTMESLGNSSLGAVTAYYTSDVGQIDSFAGRILGKAFPDLVGWVVTIGMIFWFDVYLGIAAILVTIAPALLLHRMSRPIARGTREYQEALEEANQSVIKGLYNLETTKASCQEDTFIQNHDEKLMFLQKKKRKVAIWEVLLGAPMLVSAFGTIILLTSLSGWFVFIGRITAGQLLTVVTLTDNIVTFVMSLDGTISASRRAFVSLQRLNSFLVQEEERKDGREVEAIREIAFRDIYFAYPGRDKMECTSSIKEEHLMEEQPSMKEQPFMEEGHSMEKRPSMKEAYPGEIYHGFSEVWRQGKIIFIKGGNGEGKSTLVKLLLGVYNVLAGQICINGIPMRKYRLGSLREKIVVVPQENILFHGSIRDNLACGKDITLGQMEEACRRTGIHEEILRMAEGYDTVLTENGGVLSGGQKQRLCLARALLRRGDVYIFDEPATALDRGNRERLADLLQELSRDRMVVVITHEQELLDGAQWVVEMGTSCG